MKFFKIRAFYFVLTALVGSLFFFLNCSSSSDHSAAPVQTESVDVDFKINTSNISFSNINLQIFSSSNYYPGLRTEAGHALFINEFPKHSVVRTNAFDWSVVLADGCQPQGDYSNCVEAFKNALETNRAYIESILKLNQVKILVFDLFRTPTWLSTHPDSGSACGGGKLGQSYRPTNYNVWRSLVLATANFAKSVVQQSPPTQIYYQFWNEPDLDCNWREGTAEFLQFYSETMPYLKSIHPEAKVGGTNLEHWNGRVKFDVTPRPQNLNFDLMQLAKENSLPMDFVSFHYFSINYSDDFLVGMQAYRAFQASKGILEANMPIYLSEWLPQKDLPNGFNPHLAADAANLFVSMFDAKLLYQGGVPFQDYGSTPDEEWGTVTFSPVRKKPIFFVTKFFDDVAKTSLGVAHFKNNLDLQIEGAVKNSTFTIGERRYFISKKAQNCFDMSFWNRIASEQDAAVAFLLSEGLTLQDFKNAYGNDNATMLKKLLEAIRNGIAFDPKWIAAYKAAQTIFTTVTRMNESTEYDYNVNFEGHTKFKSIKAWSVSRNGSFYEDKSLSQAASNAKFSLRPSEIVFSEICF